MSSSWPGWKQFLKNLVLRVGGAAGAVGLIILLVKMGDWFDISFLQSQGGILVAVIIVGELLFFSVLIYAVIRGDM